MLVHLRTRGAVILALVGGMAVLSVSAVSANTARPAALSSTLTFITSGMSCAKGVCALGSGNVGANYGQDIAITVGTSYLQNFFLSGGVAPYTASITAGQLPPGLSLSASPPISITGTPTTRGTFMFTVTVTDSKGAQATKSGSITVS